MPDNNSGFLRSKSVVEKLDKDLAWFKEHVNSDCNDLSSLVGELSAIWNDAQYDKFAGVVSSLISALKADVAVLDEATQALRKEIMG